MGEAVRERAEPVGWHTRALRRGGAGWGGRRSGGAESRWGGRVRRRGAGRTA